MPMHTHACTHTLFSCVDVIHIQFSTVCRCAHTEKGRKAVCNCVKPESTDHCCAITFLQKRTEKSKRKGKERRSLPSNTSTRPCKWSVLN